MNHISEKRVAIGYRALVDRYNLLVIPHFRWSFLLERGARRALLDQNPAIYLYDQDYALDNSNDPLEHLAFALKHEGLNLEIIAAFFTHVSHISVCDYVQAQPSGKYQRMIWCLYEQLTNKTLDCADLTQGSYIDLLDSEEYYTSSPIPLRRYRINDNLLGDFRFCPFVRKTNVLKIAQNQRLDHAARDMMKAYEKTALERASTYLYAQETMSSYKIERERPNKQRLARFIQLIKQAETVEELTKDVLIELQNSIVADRFINQSYRITQNYIGQSHSHHHHHIIHYISPTPDFIQELMNGLLSSLQRMLISNVHPIIIAATSAFAFVFIHPFDDGNGRLHRFLIHYILHQTEFTPPNMIFPISATILADMQQYTNALEHYSKPLLQIISDYDISDDGELVVHQKTDSFYRYIDYTAQTEFLAACIARTIQTDFKKELEYVIRYDQTKKELAEIVDMPDRLIDLFITLTLQNKGVLSGGKQATHFSMLTNDEIKLMEAVVARIFL